MAFRSFKKDIDKIYVKIDKIAKAGRDNYSEYNNYVENLVTNSQYALFTQVLDIKYGFDFTKFKSLEDLKKKSWEKVLFLTRTNLSETKNELLKSNSLYQIGLDVFKESIIPYARVIDTGIGMTAGTASDLKLVIAEDQNKGVLSIEVLKRGYNYTTSSIIEVYGGSPSATASPIIRGGFVIGVNLGGSGSFHGNDFKVGSIEEVDKYVTSIDPIAYTDNIYQQIIKNKVTFLRVQKVGVTSSLTFSTWNFTESYDKNVTNLWKEVINYLI
jgi:hypothetical protein